MVGLSPFSQNVHNSKFTLTQSFPMIGKFTSPAPQVKFFLTWWSRLLDHRGSNIGFSCSFLLPFPIFRKYLPEMKYLPISVCWVMGTTGWRYCGRVPLSFLVYLTNWWCKSSSAVGLWSGHLVKARATRSWAAGEKSRCVMAKLVRLSPTLPPTPESVAIPADHKQWVNK